MTTKSLTEALLALIPDVSSNGFQVKKFDGIVKVKERIASPGFEIVLHEPVTLTGNHEAYYYILIETPVGISVIDIECDLGFTGSLEDCLHKLIAWAY